ncbi:MAG TPA: helix-turn-helix transcriptional regulator [Tepidanaerobacteraceae bacterium]|nr:helix-turn-helix transcriptional regulator [Tepidanaerobacteraceae bacterium]
MEDAQKEFRILFGKRLRQALIERDMKQSDLAGPLNVTDKQVSFYATGKGLPTVYGLMVMCKVLNVSADFLLGLRSDPAPLEGEDPLADDILMMRESYAQMSDELKAAFQNLVLAILRQKP